MHLEVTFMASPRVHAMCFLKDNDMLVILRGHRSCYLTHAVHDCFLAFWITTILKGNGAKYFHPLISSQEHRFFFPVMCYILRCTSQSGCLPIREKILQRIFNCPNLFSGWLQEEWCTYFHVDSIDCILWLWQFYSLEHLMTNKPLMGWHESHTSPRRLTIQPGG